MTLLFPIAGVPKARGHRLGLGDDCLQPDRPRRCEPVFRLLDQVPPQTMATMGGSDDQPVDRPPPTIPGGNHRADETAIVLGNDQCRRVVGDQSSETVGIVGVGGLSLAFQPEPEYELDI